MKECTICKSAHREKIEQVLYKMPPNKSTKFLEEIAEEFEVSVSDLQRHILFHTSYNAEEGSDSIVRRAKLRELDLLGTVAHEYMDTLQSTGRRIRGYVDDQEDGSAFEKKLGKPTVDLYLGCGDNLQKTVRAIADIDNLLNGPKDDGLAGLAALASAIHQSRPTVSESDGD